MTKRSARAATVKGSRRAATVKRSAAARQTAAVKRSKRTKPMSGAKPANRTPGGAHRKTFRPSRKITAATIGSAIAALALYAANAFATKNGSPAVPAEMASMVTVVATFAAGWLIPPGAREAIIETERGHRMAVG
jgi:hypothetical protein